MLAPAPPCDAPRAGADLDEDQSPVPVPQDQVDFAATTAGGPIIPGHQPQASRLKVGQSPRFGGITALFGAGLTL
jgi:hypothetical protein